MNYDNNIKYTIYLILFIHVLTYYYLRRSFCLIGVVFSCSLARNCCAPARCQHR